MHYFAIFFSKNEREVELVVLHTINPMNSTKWVTAFSWLFHFSLKLTNYTNNKIHLNAGATVAYIHGYTTL